MPALRRALAFLGVAPEETAVHPSELLQAALGHFDPHRLTHCSDHRVA
jgi:hypothetical protein